MLHNAKLWPLSVTTKKKVGKIHHKVYQQMMDISCKDDMQFTLYKSNHYYYMPYLSALEVT